RDRVLPFAPRCCMQKCVAAIVIVFSSVAASMLPLAAQQGTAQPQATPDPGVNPVRLLDRDEIRVTRVELAPGAVRSAHSHDDVAHHVWAPVGGTPERTIVEVSSSA